MTTETRPEEALTARFAAIVDRFRRQGSTEGIADLEACIDQAEAAALRGEIAKFLGFYFLRAGQIDKSIRWSDMACTFLPHDHECLYNATFARFQSGRWEETITLAERGLDLVHDPLEFCNILCTTLGALGRQDEAAAFGVRALQLKQATAVTAAKDLSRVPVPPFDATSPLKNIISFSLFGAAPKYTDGAVLNARAAPFLYPGWTCRFYIDETVPRSVREALISEGAQVMMVGGLPQTPYGTFWRFLAAEDASIDRYILRDADSLINTRERVAVDEWIQSGRHFHVMRDHFDHAELVLAGMWGGVRGALPPVIAAARRWFGATPQIPGKTADQQFLREVLWPTIRQSVLTHDSQFDFGEHRDFPAAGRLPPGCWVGCQWTQLTGRPGAA